MNIDFVSHYGTPTWHGNNVFSVYALGSKQEWVKFKNVVFGSDSKHGWIQYSVNNGRTSEA